MVKRDDLLRFIFMVVVLSLTTMVNAQERLVVDDVFQGNNHYWPEGDFGYAKVKWSKSLYTIERTREQGESVFTIDNYIDPNVDFSIEANLQVITSQEGFCGLVWNYADMNNFDAFSISASGKYAVVVCRSGQFFHLSATSSGDHSVSDAFKKGKWNSLKVERRGDFYHYFINDTFVFKAEFPGYAHPAHGFYITKRCTMQASAFKIKQAQVINRSSDLVAPKEKLGSEINTDKNESSPLISPDGSLLFFTRSQINSHDADVWVSKKLKDGMWDKATSVGFPLNNNVHNSVLSCAADNRSLLLLNTYFADGSYKGCCFSQSQWEAGKWNLPEDVNIKNFNHYGKWLDASLSADKTTMLLSALRSGTLGYNDLYVSFLTEKGMWSEPLNLGRSINTRFNEAAPFLASDHKTIYFSSLGHPGYGNQDIFMSKRLDDSWTRWSTPVNLGPSINTEGFDAFFSIASNDPWAYLVSNKDAVGGTDIFRVPLPPSLLPHPVCVLSGKVMDKSKNLPLHATLFYQSLSDEKVKGVLYSDPQTGAYQLVLPDTGTYYISAEKKNYYGQADTLSFSYRSQASTQQQLNVYLDPLVVGKSFSIRQLQFEQSKAVLLPSSIPALKQLITLLKANPNMVIRIEGHTDNVGDPELNRQLSVLRAEAVCQYLIAQGIEETRMEVKGYGGAKPIADNAKEETRRLNRRVEFVILVKE